MRALVIDWGIGGFSVVRQIQKKQLALDMIYVSDSGYTPYGKLSKSKVRSRIARLVADVSRAQKLDLVIIACNAASTAFVGSKKIGDIPVINMIEPTAKALAKLKKKNRITVVGGDLTVSSAKYSELLRDTPHKVREISLQPLSALIEQGHTNGVMVERVLKVRLKSLKNKKRSRLVLACTHYPAAKKTFKKLFRDIDVLDPAEPVVKSVRRALGRQKKGESLLVHVYTTGDVKAMPRVLKKSFGMEIDPELFQKFPHS